MASCCYFFILCIDFGTAATADEGHLPTEPRKTGVQFSSESNFILNDCIKNSKLALQPHSQAPSPLSPFSLGRGSLGMRLLALWSTGPSKVCANTELCM